MLLVGLGNPGAEYARTRHNVGFMVVDRFVEQRHGTWTHPSSLYDEAVIRYAGRQVRVVKPLTYMNASGEAVKRVMEKHGYKSTDVYAVVDEYNFPVGTVNLRPRGSDGGHNGMLSLIDELGTQEFWRIRLGIGRGFGPGGLVDYVLSPFPDEEHASVTSMVNEAVHIIEKLLTSSPQHSRNPR